MKNSTLKFTFFRTVLAVTIATMVSASAFSSKLLASSSTGISSTITKSFAKTKGDRIRQTGKETTKRNSGIYKTDAKVTTTSNRVFNSNVNAATKTTIKLREPNPVLAKTTTLTSINAFGFEIFDATVFLVGDVDGDGFYSDFDVEMDVDVDSGTANVYAEIFFLNENGNWQLLTTTDVFSITDNLASDSFTTAITLVDGFQANYYDLLIDVYEDGFAGIVATLEPFDDADLGFIPLEDLFSDSIVDGSQLLLNQLSMKLFDDFDFDGFFHGFQFDISLENDTYGRNLQAIFYTRDSLTGWIEEVSTTAVFVNRGSSVTFSIDGHWETGYPTDLYDFLVEVIDIDSGEIVKDFGPEFQALFERPMESSNFDVNTNSIIIDEGYSSGSTNSILLLFILFVMIIRFYRNQPRMFANK